MSHQARSFIADFARSSRGLRKCLIYSRNRGSILPVNSKGAVGDAAEVVVITDGFESDFDALKAALPIHRCGRC